MNYICKDCPVCHKSFYYISPHHIGKSDCVCKKHDLYDDLKDDGNTDKRTGILHILDGVCYYNNAKGKTPIVEGKIFRLQNSDITSQAICDEIDLIEKEK